MRTPTAWARPKRLRPPGFIVPCQPIIARTVPTGDGWIHELKHDGFRIIAHKDGDKVHLWSRNRRDRSGDFVAIANRRAHPARLPHRARRRGGRALPRRNARLPPAVQRRRPGERLLYAFDLIWLETQDLRGVELIGRGRSLPRKGRSVQKGVTPNLERRSVCWGQGEEAGLRAADGRVAQRIEHQPSKLGVAGSSPAAPAPLGSRPDGAAASHKNFLRPS
jgi:ATP dependent DNA ligase domain